MRSTIRFYLLAISLFLGMLPVCGQIDPLETEPIKGLIAAAETAEYSAAFAKAAVLYQKITEELSNQYPDDAARAQLKYGYCLAADKQLLQAEQSRRLCLYQAQNSPQSSPVRRAYAYVGMAAAMKLRRNTDSLAYWTKQAQAIIDTLTSNPYTAAHKARLFYELCSLLNFYEFPQEAVLQLDNAQEWLKKAYRIDKTLQLRIFTTLCNIHFHLKNYAKVRRYYQLANDLAATMPPQRIKTILHLLAEIRLDLIVANQQPEVSLKAIADFEKYTRDAFGDTAAIYLKSLGHTGLICKDILGNPEEMNKRFQQVDNTLRNNPNLIIEEPFLSDTYRNWGYTLLEHWSTDNRYDTTYAHFHRAFLLSLSPQYRNLKYNEYPDFRQPDIYQHGFILTYRALMGLQYNLFTHYTHKRQANTKANLLKIIPVINEMKNILLANTYDAAQRQKLAAVFEDYYYKKMEMYGDFYGQDSALSTQKELFITLQQLNSRETRFGINQQQSLKIAQVDDDLISQQVNLTRTVAELNYQLAAAQKLNDKANMLVLSNQILQKRTALAQLDQRIKQQYPRYGQLLTQLPTVAIDAIQAQLGDKAMLIYGTARYRTLQLIITKDTVCHFYDFIDRDNVWQPKLDSLRGFLQTPPANDANYSSYKQSFYTLLYQVSKQFFKQDSFLQARKISDLIIVPDPLLANIPFELILTAPNEPKDSYKDWHFAIKKYQIQYLPDVNFWLQSQQQSQQNTHNGKILAFAPTYIGVAANPHRAKPLNILRANLSELSGAKSELANLAAYYRGDYFNNQQAHEAQFKRAMAQPYAVVHLAMHGLLDEDAAELSSLAFAETADTAQDNFLTAYEIAQMRYNTQLVILSACETAAGETQTGEGVLSLARYFIYGGAPAVVATRWQINDQTTAFIMQNFYLYLYQGQTIKQALQRAQLDYLAQAKGSAAHPFYWAAFMNIGHTDKPVYIANRNWYYKYIFISIGVLVSIAAVWAYARRRRE